jgi:hypothetical protein
VREYSIWENEFFNRSFRKVYALAGPGADPLAQTPAAFRASDGYLVAGGKVVDAAYVLADGTTDIKGHLVATDPIGLRLVRVDGPVRTLTRVTGLYPNDTWSRQEVTYVRRECSGGTLRVLLGSDPSLYKQAQTVVARVGAAVVGRAHIAPTAQTTLRVPLRPAAGTSNCTASFAVARTLVPERVEKGSRDTRHLGARFLRFDYRG